MIRNKQPKKNKQDSHNSNREDVSQIKAKQKRPSSGKGFYYSFLTVILLLCLIQITISAVLNISKIISYKAKIIQIKNTRDKAMALNEQLKDNIKNFSNVNGLEAIARNNLKMSSEDEVLVIINTSKEDTEQSEKNNKLDFIKFLKKD